MSIGIPLCSRQGQGVYWCQPCTFAFWANRTNIADRLPYCVCKWLQRKWNLQKLAIIVAMESRILCTESYQLSLWLCNCKISLGKGSRGVLSLFVEDVNILCKENRLLLLKHSYSTFTTLLLIFLHQYNTRVAMRIWCLDKVVSYVYTIIYVRKFHQCIVVIYLVYYQSCLV